MRELHRPLVPLPGNVGRLDDPEHVCGIDREGVLARGSRELPCGEEPITASALASRRVRNPTALEEEPDATAVVAGLKMTFRCDLVSRSRPERFDS